MAENTEDNVLIPRWHLKHIEDTLRIVSNILDSHSKTTSADRDIIQARAYANNALDGKSDKIVNRF